MCSSDLSDLIGNGKRHLVPNFQPAGTGLRRPSGDWVHSPVAQRTPAAADRPFTGRRSAKPAQENPRGARASGAGSGGAGSGGAGSGSTGPGGTSRNGSGPGGARTGSAGTGGARAGAGRGRVKSGR